MGRAAEHQLKVGILVVGLVGLCAWRLSHENGPRMAVALSAGIAQAQAHSALPAPAAGGGGGGGGGDGEREHSPATARLQGNGKWWAEWADGRARPFPIHKLDKPAGTLASVICITALPERLTPVTGHPTALTELAIRDLWQQADVVVLAVPVASHTDASAAGRIGVPSWIGAYEEKVVVVRTRIDYGPSTRIIGCMFAVPEEYGDKVALIEADDDDAYPPNFVSGFMAYLSRDPTSAFSLSGFATDGNMLGEAGPPALHSACPDAVDAGRTKCTMAASILEGFMGLAVLRRYLRPELELVANHSTVPLACFYGDDSYVSYSIAAAGAQPRVVFDATFNAFTFNKQQKGRADIPQKSFCLTSKVPGLGGSCPNMEAYQMCKAWFDNRGV